MVGCTLGLLENHGTEANSLIEPLVMYPFGFADGAQHYAPCRSLPDLVNEVARDIERNLPPREIGSSSDKIGLQRQLDRIFDILQNQVGHIARYAFGIYVLALVKCLVFEGSSELDSSLVYSVFFVLLDCGASACTNLTPELCGAAPQTCSVRTFGLWGMGGAGKTTMAEALRNVLSREFSVRSTCYLKGMRNQAQQPEGYLQMQKKLLTTLVDHYIPIPVNNIEGEPYKGL